MFSRSVVTSDAFLDMPSDAQALYFQLNIAADDRGICDRPRMIMRMMRASDDTMKLLITKKFVLIPACNNQVVVIKHWRINNNMRAERFKETKYPDVLNELFYDENKSYSLNPGDGHYPVLSDSETVLLLSGTQAAPKGSRRIDKNRKEESREEEIREDKNSICSINLSEPQLSDQDRMDRIAEHAKRIQMFVSHNYNTSGLYSLAAADGFSREEIDAYIAKGEQK